MKNQPLFLPKGSVRAILVLVLTGFVCAGVFFRVEIPEQVIIIWAGAMGWYFGGKIDEVKQNQENDKRIDSAQ